MRIYCAAAAGPEKTERYLEVLEDQADRLAHLIEDILEMTALDSGDAVTAWSPVFLTTLVSDTATKFDQRAKEADLLLEIEPFDSSLPIVYGDATRLSQVMEELMENAIQFTPAGGRVNMKLEAVEKDGQSWVYLTVSDTGPGIAAEEQESIFKRFFRGKVAESGQIPGTGFGAEYGSADCGGAWRPADGGKLGSQGPRNTFYPMFARASTLRQSLATRNLRSVFRVSETF